MQPPPLSITKAKPLHQPPGTIPKALDVSWFILALSLFLHYSRSHSSARRVPWSPDVVLPRNAASVSHPRRRTRRSTVWQQGGCAV